ncbi:MAG: extracellular solute-binding protein [Promicromonosporaceae bacterium]|nr:extracellular solute-binding protein [Promicromonosporaceae bacterium]
MRTRKTMALLAVTALAVAGLSACGNDDGGSATPPAAETGGEEAPATEVPAEEEPAEPGEVITLTWGGWDLDRVPEFRALADAFNASQDRIVVENVDYPNAEWLTVMTADLAAGTAPDIITLRGLPEFATWSAGGMLRDLTHIANSLDPSTQSLDAFVTDGQVQGLPFRQDHWVVYYNADLFAAAGVDTPSGEWTWDEYVETARALQAGGLPDGVFPAYQHGWGDSTVGGWAVVQTPGADLFSGDFSFLAPYYERALILDNEGLQPSFGTVTTGSLHHLAEFGQQRVAMVPMGTWFMSQLVNPENEVDDFNWSVVAAPQFDDSTLGRPISQAAVTGVAINARLDEDKVAAAEEFITFVVDEGGAAAVAGLGLVPPFTNDAIMDVMFGVSGMPADDVARAAITNVDGRIAFPNNPLTAIVVTILQETHSVIMTESVSIEDGIAQADARFASEAG